MLRSMARITFGYAVASLVAGLTLALHVITPADLSGLGADKLSDRVIDAGFLAAAAGTYIGVFALPFALILLAIAEWFSLRRPLYFAFAGLAIAGTGFVAQQAGEVPGQSTIANPFAIQAFVLSGLLGGLAYWLLAGRRSGNPPPATPVDRK